MCPFWCFNVYLGKERSKDEVKFYIPDIEMYSMLFEMLFLWRFFGCFGRSGLAVRLSVGCLVKGCKWNFWFLSYKCCFLYANVYVYKYAHTLTDTYIVSYFIGKYLCCWKIKSCIRTHIHIQLNEYIHLYFCGVISTHRLIVYVMYVLPYPTARYFFIFVFFLVYKKLCKVLWLVHFL